MQRNFVSLLSARFSSDLAAFMALTIFTSYIYVITGNAYYVGAFFAFRVLGTLAGSVLAPRLFQLGSIQKRLTGIEIVRSAMILLLLLLPLSVQKLYLPFAAIVLGMGNAFFNIGLNLKIGRLFEDKQLLSINSWVSTLSSFGLVLGSLLAGLLLSALKYPSLFMIDALIYLVSAASLFFIQDRIKGTTQAQSSLPHRHWKQLWPTLKEHPVLFILLCVTLIDTLASGSHNVGQPILAKWINPTHPGQILGFLITTWALGKLLGAWLIKIINRYHPLQIRLIERLFFMGVLMMSGSFILLFWQTQLSWILLFALCAGAGDGLSEVNLLTRIQKAPHEVKMVLFSCMTLLQMSGLMIGIVLCTPFFAQYHPAQVVTCFHGLALLGSLFLYFVYQAIMKNKA